MGICIYRIHTCHGSFFECGIDSIGDSEFVRVSLLGGGFDVKSNASFPERAHGIPAAPIPFPSLKTNSTLSSDQRGGSLSPWSIVRPQTASGFALIVTLSLMVLLTVIAVGLLSLASISLRTSSTSAARAEAQANARLALMLAIGDLQKEVGPDQRITARAEILDSNSSTSTPDNVANPMWLGAWNSWDTWLNASGINATYTPGRESKFRRWLVSHPTPTALGSFGAAQNPGTIPTVELVGKGTLGTTASTSLQVKVPTLPLTKGACAWWIGGENQKAHVAASDPPDNNLAGLNRRSQRPEGGAEKLDGLSSLPTTTAVLSKLPDLRTLEVTGIDTAARDKLPGHFHDLSVESVGLLTDVRKGGLKKDLNLLLENDSLPVEYGTEDFLDQTHTGTVVSLRPLTADVPKGRYPQKPNFTSWYKLHQYYSLYKGGTGSGGQKRLYDSGGPRADLFWAIQNTGDGLFYDGYGFDLTPIISRYMLFFSTRRVEMLTGGASFTPRQYEYKLSVNPVIALWNPYNVTMKIPGGFGLADSAVSAEYKITVPSDPSKNINWSAALKRAASGAADSISLRVAETGTNQNIPIVLQPGESRIYSVRASSSIVGTTAWLNPGYDPNGGGGFDVSIAAGNNPSLSKLIITQNADGSMPEVGLALRVFGQTIKEGQEYNFHTQGGVGTDTRYSWFCGHWLPLGMSIPIIPDKDGERVTKFSDLRFPFSSLEFVLKSGERMLNPAIQDANGVPQPVVDYRCRSFIHANPTNARYAQGLGTDGLKTMSQYGLNIRAGSGSQLNPDVASNNGAYMGSAISLGDGDYTGQTRVVTSELPVVPVISLASLMHFTLSPGKPGGPSRSELFDVAPNQMLAIGNSFSHPLIPGSGIYQDKADFVTGKNDRDPCRDVYDHAFFNNDALWDEWFCSGITRQDQGVFKDSRNLKKVADDFVDGNKPLPNPHLRSYPGALSPQELKDLLVSGSAPATDSWKYASSCLLLEGAFNVNSTAVEAWKALFWGLQDSSVRYLDPSTGILKDFELSSPQVVLSRFTLPCSSGEGVDAGDPNSWLGVRLLTKDQIDKLAEECVRQVKLRGPFLNLSDFINRRLSDNDLGTEGALQAAIDWDEFNGNSPNASAANSINARFKNSADMITSAAISYTPNPAFSPVGNPALPNPKAATGSRWTGIPGYLTQADLLKRIGNQISTRDDTFRIRAYGDAKDAAGKILARAWCEAVVQRMPEYVDQSDAALTGTNVYGSKMGNATPPYDYLTTPGTKGAAIVNTTNQTFGRRFHVVSFRWLNANEI